MTEIYPSLAVVRRRWLSHRDSPTLQGLATTNCVTLLKISYGEAELLAELIAASTIYELPYRMLPTVTSVMPLISPLLYILRDTLPSRQTLRLGHSTVADLTARAIPYNYTGSLRSLERSLDLALSQSDHSFKH